MPRHARKLAPINTRCSASAPQADLAGVCQLSPGYRPLRAAPQFSARNSQGTRRSKISAIQHVEWMGLSWLGTLIIALFKLQTLLLQFSKQAEFCYFSRVKPAIEPTRQLTPINVGGFRARDQSRGDRPVERGERVRQGILRQRPLNGGALA